jgi:hypothetical protein
MKVVKNTVQVIIYSPSGIKNKPSIVKKFLYFQPLEGEIIEGEGSGMVKIATDKRMLEFKFDNFSDGSAFLNRMFFSSSVNTFTFESDENGNLKTRQ